MRLTMAVLSLILETYSESPYAKSHAMLGDYIPNDVASIAV